MNKRKIRMILGIVIVVTIVLTALVGGPAPREEPAEGTSGVPVQTTAGTLPPQTSGATERADLPPQQTTAPTGPEETEPRETTRGPEEAPEETTQPTKAHLQFPLALEDGQLMVESLFQFSGMNPDAQDQFGDNIAGLQLTNSSEQFLLYAELTAVLSDGRTLTFRAENVPPGKTVLAFCLEHEPLEDVQLCEQIYGQAEFAETDHLRMDLVQISVSGVEIILQNVSGRDLTDLNVYCHGVLDDSYFGGTTYCYNVASLPAGGSVSVYAGDCILGMVETVRIEYGG